MRLRSEWLQLDLAPVLDRPLYLDQFSGLFGWAQGPGGALRLTGRNLVLENPDLAGRVRFDLDLPAPGRSSGSDGASGPFLDLRASLHDGNGAAVRTYLPVGIMHPNLVRWLERALVDGRIPEADLILRGPLRDYPFREHQGRFELLLEIEEGGLDYLGGWPPIEAANGTLHFLNQGMEVRIESARMLDSALTAGRARMQVPWGPRRLSIHGEAQGPLSDGLRILGETPLAARLGPLAQSLEVAGVSHVTLDLEVPLKQGEPLGLEGRLTWPGPAQVALKGTPLTLTDLAGDLRFTQDALTAESIGARLWGHPLTLSIATRNPGDPENAGTEIRARSRSRCRIWPCTCPRPYGPSPRARRSGTWGWSCATLTSSWPARLCVGGWGPICVASPWISPPPRQDRCPGAASGPGGRAAAGAVTCGFAAAWVSLVSTRSWTSPRPPPTRAGAGGPGYQGPAGRVPRVDPGGVSGGGRAPGARPPGLGRLVDAHPGRAGRPGRWG